MNAKDRADLERFARKLVAAEALRTKSAKPARTGEARVVTITPAEPLEQTWR